MIAELPGLEEKDIEILSAENVLTLKGETKHEEQDGDREFSERYYGRFERRITQEPDIDADGITATFKNGLLKVTLSSRLKRKSRRGGFPSPREYL